MLPVYLAYLSKEEFGLFDYILTIGTFFSVIISMEVTQAVYRFVPEYKDDLNKQNQYMASAFWFVMAAYVLVSVIVFSNVSRIEALLFEGTSHASNLLQWTFLAYFAMSLLYITLIFQRAQFNSKGSTVAACISALLTAMLSWVAIAHFKLGVVGLLAGLAIGQLSVGLVNCLSLASVFKYRPSLTRLKEMLAFSSPLVLSSLGVLTATLIDKVMIKEMMSLADLGEYGVAARFASVLTLIMVGIQSALAPLVYSNHQDPTTRTKLLQLLKGYVVLSLGGVAVLYFIAEPLILLLVGEGFERVYVLLPVLALAVVIQAGYAFFPGLNIYKKTAMLAALNVFTGLVNIVLNYWLIPLYGLFGAASATLVSSVLYFSLNALFSEKYYPIIFQKRKPS
ncbi:polysaccharide biosynthesis protein [Pseudoalteromonas luteoviolacea B = ATCC 29581]|nr:polysaccharide biosynthesis protein [Pseudoalteromonas luteoviolacea B = ATCC 29581]